MKIESGEQFGQAPGARYNRGPWLPLLSAVMELAGEHAELLRHGERHWSHGLFEGTRHTIALTFRGAAMDAAGEAFMEALPEHEFAIPGHLVADAAVVTVEQDAQRLTIEADFVLLQEI